MRNTYVQLCLRFLLKQGCGSGGGVDIIDMAIAAPADAQKEEEAPLTSCSPIGAGREDASGIVKEKRRDCLVGEKMGDGEGGWDWLVVLGGLPFQASVCPFDFWGEG